MIKLLVGSLTGVQEAGSQGERGTRNSLERAPLRVHANLEEGTV